jgi:hypothetical protein
MLTHRGGSRLALNYIINILSLFGITVSLADSSTESRRAVLVFFNEASTMSFLLQ